MIKNKRLALLAGVLLQYVDVEKRAHDSCFRSTPSLVLASGTSSDCTPRLATGRFANHLQTLRDDTRIVRRSRHDAGT